MADRTRSTRVLHIALTLAATLAACDRSPAASPTAPPPAAVDFVRVDVPPGDLAAVLRDHAAQARARGLRPFAYLHAAGAHPATRSTAR